MNCTEIEENGMAEKILPVNGELNAIDGCQRKLNESSAVLEKSEIGLTTNDSDQNGKCSEHINDFSYEATETSIENDLIAENKQLKETLTQDTQQYGNLQNLLQHKDEVLELQKKELSLLEGEKESLRREYETAKKEKEHAVVRYAMLEKNIIDANAAKDLSARKFRDSQKEVEQLTNRLKIVSGERDKAHKEIRDNIREIETLRYDLQTCETKLKWSQVKLKQEITNKADLETKLNETNEQLSQLNEQRQQKIDCEKKSEQEQGAQLIMLRHLVDEKERNFNQIQKTFNETKSEFASLIERNEIQCREFEAEKHKCIDLQAKIDDIELAMDERNKEYDALEMKFKECVEDLALKTVENERNIASINKLKYIEESYRDQSEEMSTLRRKEDDFLALLKDLTEKCVLVENKLILANSKASALMLDNERLNKEYKSKSKAFKELEDDIAKIKLKHSEEIKLFNRILGDEKNHSETLQNKYDNIVGDLEATKNKHSQVVKELNRELSALRKQNSNGSPYSGDSGFGTDMDNTNEGNKSQTEPHTNGTSSTHNQEPSKKVLIDRIVKLQRQLAKQTEKIEFLENHCVALFNELKNKTV